MAAPQGGFVDDVIVQQRGRVDHFDHGGEHVMILPAISCRTRGQNEQRRPQPLAAALDDVFGHLPDEHDVGIEGLAHDTVYRGHVSAYR